MHHFRWAVIGAGPAGIATIGKLLDTGVSPHKIIWIDPHFTVGDLGKKWYDIDSNTKVKSFVKALNSCHAFNYQSAPVFSLSNFELEQTCQLSYIVEPLQWISNHLKTTVTTITDLVDTLYLSEKKWHIGLNNASVTAKQVILATGSSPKKLSYPIKEIPLETVLNREKLCGEKLDNETIAVFGASHSAIIALKNLLQCNPKKVINVYKHPIKYAAYLDDFILFDNTGLKGDAAEWAKTYIDGTLPDNLERIHCDDHLLESKLEQCTFVAYAVGFEKNQSFTISSYPRALQHNATNGIIAPSLFGIGIAYPNKVKDPLGNIEYDVGVCKFVKHLEKCLPIWLQYYV